MERTKTSCGLRTTSSPEKKRARRTRARTLLLTLNARPLLPVRDDLRKYTFLIQNNTKQSFREVSDMSAAVISVSEMANELSLSKSTIYRRLAACGIEHISVEGRTKMYGYNVLDVLRHVTRSNAKIEKTPDVGHTCADSSENTPDAEVALQVVVISPEMYEKRVSGRVPATPCKDAISAPDAEGAENTRRRDAGSGSAFSPEKQSSTVSGRRYFGKSGRSFSQKGFAVSARSALCILSLALSAIVLPVPSFHVLSPSGAERDASLDSPHAMVVDVEEFSFRTREAASASAEPSVSADDRRLLPLGAESRRSPSPMAEPSVSAFVGSSRTSAPTALPTETSETGIFPEKQPEEPTRLVVREKKIRMKSGGRYALAPSLEGKNAFHSEIGGDRGWPRESSRFEFLSLDESVVDVETAFENSYWADVVAKGPGTATVRTSVSSKNGTYETEMLVIVE